VTRKVVLVFMGSALALYSLTSSNREVSQSHTHG